MNASSTRAADRLIVGVDVGGTKSLAALVRISTSDDGSVGAVIVDRHEGPSSADSAEAIEVIADGARSMIEQSRRTGGGVQAVGVGLAGFLGLDGVIVSSPNAPGLVGVDIQSLLSEQTGVPTFAENDANCVALAAHRLVAPWSRHLVAVTLGTGIGGGLIVDGKLLRGAHGFAAEPGHMVVDRDGPECPCGQRGCWERFASGAGLAFLARRAAAAGRAPSLVELAGTIDAIRGEDVTALLDEGDDGAADVFSEYLHYVAIGVANLIVLLDPEVVVIGGGLSELGERLLDGVRDELGSNFPAASANRGLQIVSSPGGPEAGALGAALAAAARIGQPG